MHTNPGNAEGRRTRKDMNSGVHVPYMSEMQRDAYKVTVHNGVFWWQYAPLDMRNQSFLYVMDAGGRFSVARNPRLSITGRFPVGQPVAAARDVASRQGKRVVHQRRQRALPAARRLQRPVHRGIGQAWGSLTAAKTDFDMTSEQMKLRMKKHRAVSRG